MLYLTFPMYLNEEKDWNPDTCRHRK